MAEPEESEASLSESKEMIEEQIVESTGVTRKKIYIKRRLLGEHPCGKYYLIQDINLNSLYRAKVIHKADLKNKDKSRLLVEIRNQKKFQHPNFLGLRNVFEDSECVYLLTDHCPNGSIEELLQRRSKLSEQEVSFYCNHLVEILRELAKKKVIHRDIKPENIFLDSDMVPRLGEFGASAVFEGERRKSILKRNHYSSPETINQSGHGYQADLWSVGVMLYSMLVGTEPFRVGDTFEISKIHNSSFFFPENQTLNPFWKDLLKRILVTNPDRRISIKDLSELSLPSLPESLSICLLTVPNRIPEYYSQKKKGTNRLFIKLHEANFGSQNQNKSASTSSNNLVSPDLIKLFPATFCSITSQVSKKTQFCVVQDWIIANSTIAYLIGCFVCVNFPDNSRIHNSNNNLYYTNSEGITTSISQELLSQNKILLRKVRYHQSMKESLKITEEMSEGMCPFFVEKVVMEEKYLLLLLTNGTKQLNFLEEPSQCFLMAKSRVQLYSIGKECDYHHPRLTEVEKILHSFRKSSLKS